MSKTILNGHELTKQFRIGERQVRVLDGVTLTIGRGEFVIVAGSSGSGKSTLLSILSGLDKPTSGRVILDGCDITHLGEDQLAPIRNGQTGFVFQSFHLIPSLSALENVMFPSELRRDRDALKKAISLLDRVGMQHRMDNFPSQMSGGEQQRVAICRALINNPKVIFADEPTGNLDSENSEAIINLLLELHDDHNTTLVVATHSRSIAQKAGRIIRLHDGKVINGVGK